MKKTCGIKVFSLAKTNNNFKSPKGLPTLLCAALYHETRWKLQKQKKDQNSIRWGWRREIRTYL